MKDPTKYVYDCVFGLLNGKLSHSGNIIKVYTVAPKGDNFRYVLIDNLTFNDSSTGNTNDYDCLLQINVNDYGHKGAQLKLINDVSSQIFEILLKRKWQIENFEITSGVLLYNSFISKFNTETEILVTKNLILTFSLQED